MRLALIILMLAPLAAWSEQWYVWTGTDGQPQQSTALSDVGTNAYTVADSPPPPAPVEPEPIQSPPIEVPYIVIQDVDDATAWGIYMDDGDLIGGILDHASPRDPQAIKQRLQAKITENDERKARVRALKDSPEWTKIADNLDQYTLHDDQLQTLISNATVSVELTTGANRTTMRAIIKALEKERQARADVKTIVNQTKSLFFDSVKESK